MHEPRNIKNHQRRRNRFKKTPGGGEGTLIELIGYDSCPDFQETTVYVTNYNKIITNQLNQRSFSPKKTGSVNIKLQTSNFKLFPLDLNTIAERMIAPSKLQKLINRVALYDDSAAYKELFLLYHARLISFSFSITKSKESAEEVVSDVFLKIWTKRTSLTRVNNFHLYIYIITKNISINYLVKQKREQSFSFDDTLVEFKSIYPDPEQSMITSETFRRVHLAIQALPPKCQLIFKLVKEDGLKYREVAELLELSLKTIENQMTIALKKISQAIPFGISRSSLN
jgi:RNA polymerase sigma-70 factor (family 1)